MDKTKTASMSVVLVLSCFILGYRHNYSVVSTVSRERYLDEQYCRPNCEYGVPCTYPDEVDFRVIVMTYDRPQSLVKCLDKIRALDTMGDRMSVEVWIDRALNGSVDSATVKVAQRTKVSWDNGRMCVHIQKQNAYIGGQWRNTWRPKPNTKEIGLILEDDVDISPYTYRYLKAVSQKYGGRDDISGYTLQMHDIRFFGLGHIRPMEGPASDNVFLYGVLGTWGFAPRPKAWREFQDWFQWKNASVRPLVPGILPTKWYRNMFEKRLTHGESSMWEMWHIYYTYISKTYCVYCNLVKQTGRKDVLLSVNRKEVGLHYRNPPKSTNDQYLMRKWNETYIDFPENIAEFDYNGVQIR